MTPPIDPDDAPFADHDDDAVGHGAHDPDAHSGAFADPRVQAGLEHLQRAAHEVIAASRALLDVAEELVDDPRAASHLVDLLGSVAAMARPAAGRGPSGVGNVSADDDGDDPPVQRIPVS